MRVLLKRFHLNGNTIGVHPQTQKLELHTKTIKPCGTEYCRKGSIWMVPRDEVSSLYSYCSIVTSTIKLVFSRHFSSIRFVLSCFYLLIFCFEKLRILNMPHNYPFNITSHSGSFNWLQKLSFRCQTCHLQDFPLIVKRVFHSCYPGSLLYFQHLVSCLREEKRHLRRLLHDSR